MYRIIMFLYNIAMHGLELAEHIHALFNTKSRKRKKGVHVSLLELEDYLHNTNDDRPIIWFHCASLGEFYQAEPLIELYHSKGTHRLLLSFYSPSGYDQRSEYKMVDKVFYLPTDTKENAHYLVHLINAELVVFAKYEFWFNYIDQLTRSSSKYTFISSIFRKNHYLFRFPISYISIPLLMKAQYLFVQDEQSKRRVEGYGIKQVVRTGDTRIDAVLAMKGQDIKDPKIKDFCNGKKVLVIGSSWKKDDDVYSYFLQNNTEIKIIIAPHEIHNSRINELLSIAPHKTQVYSQGVDISEEKQILIIDKIGILSSIYQLADLVYIGGAFGAGLHNTLEPAVYGVPIIFGPKYDRFEEAKYFVNNKLARTIQNEKAFHQAIDWAIKPQTQIFVKNGMEDYFSSNKNSSKKIFKILAG